MSKPQGLKGELLLSPLNPQAEWPKKLKSLKIGTQDFELETIRLHNRKSQRNFVIKLKNCNSKQEAESLKSQPVYIKKSLFQTPATETEIYLAELTGFKIIFEEGQELGQKQGQQPTAVLSHFESQAKNQDFLVVRFKDSEGKTLEQCSIPFIPEYIQKIDKKTKQIHLKLPIGFLDSFKEIYKTQPASPSKKRKS